MCKYIEYEQLEQALRNSCEKLNLSDAVTSVLIAEFNGIPILEESKVPGEYLLSGSTMNIYLKGYGQGRRDFERPKGEWEYTGMGVYQCTNCKAEYEAGLYDHCNINNTEFKFCPNCGARMEDDV